MSTKFAIVLPTYRRDNQTPTLLKNAIQSVLNQSHKNWFLFIMGDDYQPIEEIQPIVNSVPTNKRTFINAPEAKERSIYDPYSRQLRSAGGVQVSNDGINLALNRGFNWICRLDQDDWWHPEHLSNFEYVISREPKSAFICSSATYLKTTIPNQTGEVSKYYAHRPRAGAIVHSSTCVDFVRLNLRYRDVYAETGKIEAADADLWRRMVDLLDKQEYTSFCTNVLTTYNTYENGKKQTENYDHLMPIKNDSA